MVKHKNKQTQQGYTLIELALVLVVIGVLTGSMMLGRELIEDAKVKSIMNDFENFKQAHYLYIKRTGHPPGLNRDASGNFTSDTWGWGGGKNRKTKNFYFDDLIAEGLIVDRDPDKNFTIHAYGGEWIVASKRLKFAYFDGPQMCATDLPIWAAKEIDVKWDDGDPDTGRVLTGRLAIEGYDDDGVGGALTESYLELESKWGSKHIFTVCRAF